MKCRLENFLSISSLTKKLLKYRLWVFFKKKLKSGIWLALCTSSHIVNALHVLTWIFIDGKKKCVIYISLRNHTHPWMAPCQNKLKNKGHVKILNQFSFSIKIFMFSSVRVLLAAWNASCLNRSLHSITLLFSFFFKYYSHLSPGQKKERVENRNKVIFVPTFLVPFH